MKEFIHNEQSTSLNTMSAPQMKEKVFDAVKSLKENFAQNAIKCDYYKDDRGTNWIIGYVGKSQDGAEWRLWTSYKPPMDGRDANYMVEGLDESGARELFKSITGRSHNEIINSFAKALDLPRVIEKSKKQKKK